VSTPNQILTPVPTTCVTFSFVVTTSILILLIIFWCGSWAPLHIIDPFKETTPRWWAAATAQAREATEKKERRDRKKKAGAYLKFPPVASIELARLVSMRRKVVGSPVAPQQATRLSHTNQTSATGAYVVPRRRSGTHHPT
jgi:hypothetical protein